MDLNTKTRSMLKMAENIASYDVDRYAIILRKYQAGDTSEWCKLQSVLITCRKLRTGCKKLYNAHPIYANLWPSQAQQLDGICNASGYCLVHEEITGMMPNDEMLRVLSDLSFARWQARNLLAMKLGFDD